MGPSAAMGSSPEKPAAMELDTESSYDRVASEYTARYADELRFKPLDRALLDWFVGETQGRGPVADVGCGPGHVARSLHERGFPVVGVDLSGEMVAVARRLTPAVRFEQGSILDLPAVDGAWAGIAALYSIIHIAPADLARATAEFARVLQPGGVVMVSFHIGTEIRHLTDWFGQAVNLDFHFYEFADLTAAFEATGFVVEARLERRAYAPVETPTRRGYLLMRKEALDAVADGDGGITV